MEGGESLHENSQSNGKIVQSDSNHLNGAIIINGRISIEAKDDSPLQTHIEAPCCRDIHGKEPPDGGTRAWLVMISGFLCNGVIFGIINTYGVIHKLLTERLEAQGDTEASSKAAFSDETHDILFIMFTLIGRRYFICLHNLATKDLTHFLYI